MMYARMRNCQTLAPQTPLVQRPQRKLEVSSARQSSRYDEHSGKIIQS